MRIEFYAGNIHSGGAVGVAAALIPALVRKTLEAPVVDHATFVLSSEVAREVGDELGKANTNRCTITIRDDRPRLRSRRVSNAKVDARLSIFGPTHVRVDAPVEITGFADGSLIPATYEAESRARLARSSRRASNRVIDAVKLWKLRKYNAYIVQTEVMAHALSRHVSGPVWVVENVIAPTFRSPESWIPVDLPSRDSHEDRLFYPAKGYPHKNHKFIPVVCDAYQREYGRRLRVVTTLTPGELSEIERGSDECFINVGPISQAECAALYRDTDGLLFPSLNETSSSAPLEAMLMGRPVISTSLDFMMGATQGDGFYFTVGDVDGAVKAIQEALLGSEQACAQLDRARRRMSQRINVDTQADQYINILLAQNRN